MQIKIDFKNITAEKFEEVLKKLSEIAKYNKATLRVDGYISNPSN